MPILIGPTSLQIARNAMVALFRNGHDLSYPFDATN